MKIHPRQNHCIIYKLIECMIFHTMLVLKEDEMEETQYLQAASYKK